MITIYSPLETTFSGNGLATLMPLTCTVDESINGDYQLEMDHPFDNAGRWEAITEEAVLKVPSFKGDDLFRIYRVDRSLSMILRVYARHITYDMLTDFVNNSAPTNTTAAFALDTALTGTGFTGTSNVAGTNSVRWVRKNPIACIMGDDDNSIVNRWGGEVDRRQKRIDILTAIGADRGVSIRYRKNLSGLDVSSDASGVFTRVMPTCLKEDGQTVLDLPETFVDSPLIDHYAKVRTTHVHYGDIRVGETVETQAQAFEAMRKRVREAYESGLDKITFSAKVSFVDLSQTVEYADYQQLERVSLGDTVHVWHDELNIDIAARVVSVEWDCLNQRYEAITIGQETLNVLVKLNDDAARTKKELTEKTDALQEAVKEATDLLNAPGNSYVRFVPSLANPAEIYIMDAPSIVTARNVLRFNSAGWGLSTVGYMGPYQIAATANGFVADFITTGVLRAGMVKILGSDSFFWDADNIYIKVPGRPECQIRIGCYDGINYGIGFTRDDGATWTQVIDYNGMQFVGRDEFYQSATEPTANVKVGTVWFNTVSQIFLKCTALTQDVAAGTRFTWRQVDAPSVSTSGIRINSSEIQMSTPNFSLELFDPNSPDSALIRINSSQIMFAGVGGKQMFSFDLVTGNLFVEGTINATSGTIGGFIIEQNRFYSAMSSLGTDGSFKAGDLNYSPNNGMTLGDVNSPYFGINSSRMHIGTPVYFDMTKLPETYEQPNLFVNTAGQLFRSKWTSSGGSGGGTGNGFGLRIDLTSGTQIAVGASVTGNIVASGGSTPYTYRLSLFRDGVEISGPNSWPWDVFNIQTVFDGVYQIWVEATDASGNKATAWSDECRAGAGSGGTFTVTATVSATTATVGQSVTFSATAANAPKAVTWSYSLIGPNGVVTSGNTNSFTYALSSVGQWYAVFTAVSDGIERSSNTSPCQVSTSGGGTPTTGRTNGTNVNIRSRPTTNASVVTTLAHSGTQVVILGPKVKDENSSLSTEWWQVRWASSEPEMYYGYIRSDLLIT